MLRSFFKTDVNDDEYIQDEEIQFNNNQFKLSSQVVWEMFPERLISLRDDDLN